MPLTLQDFVNENGNVSIEDISDSDQKRINDALSDLTTDPGGPGRGSPTAISDWNDLADIENDLSGNYVLINDLDSTTPGWEDVGADDGTFSPISTFTGTLDGRGNAIRDLNIDGSSRFLGLFSVLTGNVKDITIDNANVTSSTTFLGVLAGNFAGTIQDVTVTNSDVTGEGYAGGLVGALNGGSIQGASVSGSGTVESDPDNSADQYKAGGIAGAAVNTGGTIANSETSVIIKGARHVGGIVGYLQALDTDGTTTITGSKATGRVEGTSGIRANGQNIGGLVGSAERTGALSIQKSYTTATVKGTENVGGLLGNDVNGSAAVTIKQSYSVADVKSDGGTAQGNVGGLVGKGSPDIDNSYAAPNINTDVDDSGTGATNVGGVIGAVNEQSDTEGTNTYWDTEKTGESSAVGDGSLSATGLTTAQIQGSNATNNLSGFDFSAEWQTNSGDYPTLQ